MAKVKTDPTTKAAPKKKAPAKKKVAPRAKANEKDQPAEKAAESGVDEESASALEDQVKKGKARKFILIYKGSTIKKLIVFKKGPYERRIQEARKGGARGDAVCGIARGKGLNLELLLPGNKEVADVMKGASAVTSEPLKPAKLRKFLADNGLKRKPRFEIVSDVAVIEKA